ncbi:hypothetical protein SLS62_000955 [Diatrype stigma]|uniref:Uncharacterized protein n=1 Tax=Diatrype stigma TaxID=117547 RepID=A0AAN9UWQ0_9PEZI
MVSFTLLALLTTTASAVAIGEPIEAADDLANGAIVPSPSSSAEAAPGGDHGTVSLGVLSPPGQVPPPPLPPSSWPAPPPSLVEPREEAEETEVAESGELAFPSNFTSPAIVEHNQQEEYAALGKKFLCTKLYMMYNNQFGIAVPSEWWQERAACQAWKQSVKEHFRGYARIRWNCYKLDSEEAARWQEYDPYILAASGWLRIQFVTPVGCQMDRGKRLLYDTRDPVGYEQNHVPVACKYWTPRDKYREFKSHHEHLQHTPHKIQD